MKKLVNKFIRFHPRITNINSVFHSLQYFLHSWVSVVYLFQFLFSYSFLPIFFITWKSNDFLVVISTVFFISLHNRRGVLTSLCLANLLGKYKQVIMTSVFFMFAKLFPQSSFFKKTAESQDNMGMRRTILFSLLLSSLLHSFFLTK